MIWISSACPVGLRLAARLAESTAVLLSAPRDRTGQARTAVAALLGYDPGDRLNVWPDELADASAVAASYPIREIWSLSYATGGETEARADFHARVALETGAACRHFDLDPIAEAPGEVVPGAFSVLMQALNATVQEVRSRDAGYFEQRALRTTLPADLAFLDAESAAAEIRSVVAGPPGRCRIAAEKADAPALSDAISDAYELELILGAAPSELAAVDRLLQSRLPRMADADAAMTDVVRQARNAGAAELASLVSDWRRHHAASSELEQARLGEYSTAAMARTPAGGKPAFHVFGQSGPVIIIVNAIAQDLTYWMRLLDRLAQEHRVVTWTQRSLVEGGQPARFDDHLQDLEAIVNAVTDEPVHLMGWCTGPKLCARYYLAHPERVASMVFLAGTYRPFGDATFDTNYETTLEMVFRLLERSPNAAASVRTTLLDALSAAPPKSAQAQDLGAEVLARTNPALLASVAAPYTSDESTLLYAKQLRDFWSHSIEPEVGAIDAPVFVITAELDRVASPRLGLRVAQALPNSTYVELPGATHYCMYDRPDEVASLVERFIGEQYPRYSSFCFSGTAHDQRTTS